MATPRLFDVILAVQKGEKPKIQILPVQLQAVRMSQASVMPMTDEWIQRATEGNRSHHQLFMVSKRTFERVNHSITLLEGDIVLSLNGKTCTTISDFDIMYSHDVLDAVIVRKCKELHLKLPTTSADDIETHHAVCFCGALLHAPHQALRQQISKLHSEVHVCVEGDPGHARRSVWRILYRLYHRCQRNSHPGFEVIHRGHSEDFRQHL